ncbi:MAG: hypothetical protein PHP50_02735 [Lachnospiraceae bacterium]|nr:hypothetical protein [Lachnospiraceae bacterium]
MIDNRRFEAAKSAVIDTERIRQGIGTLSEKTVHAILKRYYAPNEDMHEIPIGNYVADIFTGTEILEIQTAHFNVMRDKLAVFLQEYPVTIIYPIPYEKWLVWMNPETGEMTKRRKSSRKGTPYSVFKELYKIKMLLPNPNLHIHITMLNLEEYRLLDGWSTDKKKGSHRYDRIPISMEREYILDTPADYVQLLPLELEDIFTTKQLAVCCKIPQSYAQVMCNILLHLEVLERVGKEKNAYLYQLVPKYQ